MEDEDKVEEAKRRVEQGEAPPSYHRPDWPTHPPEQPPPLEEPAEDDDHASE
jgi:hypothetical protein